MRQMIHHQMIHHQQAEFRLDNQSDVPNLGIESQTCKPNFDQNLISFNNDLNKDPVNLTDSGQSVSSTDIIETSTSVENDEWFIEAVIPKKERSEGPIYGFALINAKQKIQETSISQIRQIMNDLLPSEDKERLFLNPATLK